MPLYQFYCEKCDNVFDELIHLNGKKPPTRRKCPECLKSAKRFYLVDTAVKIKGITEQSLRRQREFHEKGMNKTQADTFLNDSIKHSKERMKDGYKHYSKVVPDVNYHVKNGTARRLSEDKAKDRYKKADSFNQFVAEKKLRRSPHPQ